MGSETKTADLCGHCDKSLESTNLSIACDKCELWYHDSCTGMTKAELKVIKTSQAVLWFCKGCKEDMLPTNDSSNFRTNSIRTILNQDNHNNSDNWRKLDEILHALEVSNARFSHIEKTLESNAAKCAEKFNAVTNKFHDINSKLDENVEMLRNEMTVLAGAGREFCDAAPLTECNSCDKLEARLENMERASYQCDLVLEGLPLMPSNKSKDDLHDAVDKMCKFLDVPFQPQDISHCFRAGRDSKGHRPRPAIISFKNKSLRDALFFAYMKKRNLKLNDIVSDTGISSRIYITERITAKCKQLLRRCAALKRKNVIMKYYTRYGRLFIEKGPNLGAKLATSCLVGLLEGESNN